MIMVMAVIHMETIKKHRFDFLQALKNQKDWFDFLQIKKLKTHEFSFCEIEKGFKK